ncbi:hypothetical protein [uncultured Tolumonas sp.]|uniref:hypothetical protein n=1 Tax=uncultured Tolumonas sp. TaxID=263765 RepID=UPI002931C47A|nr:hypothetical protein [uncultured Tolumonas sp.]
MNFEKFAQPESTPEHGFGIHYFLQAFNDTFYKSGNKILDSYLNQYKDVKKWLIFSDYALYDKSKKQDVITFTLIPYIIGFDDLKKILNNLSPADLKKSKKVNANFINFLTDAPILNISFCLDRKRKLHQDERLYFETRFSMMKKQLLYWCETTPEGKQNYLEFIKKLDILSNVASSAGGNMKVIRDIEILSSLAAYIAFEITKRIDIEIIGWFSDRDSMLSYKATKFKSPIIFDFAEHLYYLFCNSEGIKSENKLVFGVPDSNNDKNVWYDSMNRIPDLIAGTLADYEIKNNIASHQKFIPVIERLFTNETKNMFFNLKFSKNSYEANRITWHPLQS